MARAIYLNQSKNLQNDVYLLFAENVGVLNYFRDVYWYRFQKKNFWLFRFFPFIENIYFQFPFSQSKPLPKIF